MEVTRKVKKEVKKVQLGDQIVLGRYTATAVAQDTSGATFCFDQVYGETPMKESLDVKRVKALYKSKAMKDVANFLVPLFDDVANVDPADQPLVFFRSPTAEEIFSKQHLRSVISTTIPGADKRWEVMKDASYRIGIGVDGFLHSYWTESLVKPDSATYSNAGSNVVVDFSGGLNFVDGNNSVIYWRPVFKLKV